MAIDYTYFLVKLTPTSGTAPSDGFVDNRPVTSYISYESNTDDMGTGWPSTAENAITKARANMRWLNIIDRVTTTISPIDIKVTTNEGGSSDAAPTTFEFVVVTDRPNSIVIDDVNNPGTTLIGADAVKRFVEMAMTDHFGKNCLVMLPQNVAKSETSNEATPNAHYGESVQYVVAGPLAADLTTASSIVSVEEIENT